MTIGHLGEVDTLCDIFNDFILRVVNNKGFSLLLEVFFLIIGGHMAVDDIGSELGNGGSLHLKNLSSCAWDKVLELALTAHADDANAFLNIPVISLAESTDF